MSDKESLEMAAKAAGIAIKRSRLDDPMSLDFLIANSLRNTTSIYGPWNPLTDDGDALRLAVKLNLVVLSDASGISTCSGQKHRAKELHGADPYSATRRAITRAAAEIGKGLP